MLRAEEVEEFMSSTDGVMMMLVLMDETDVLLIPGDLDGVVRFLVG